MRTDARRSDPPEVSVGSVPLVGYRADAIEKLPAGLYEFEFRSSCCRTTGRATRSACSTASRRRCT
jgi:hypothetical protein